GNTMAVRKFVFINQTEGYAQEQAPTDELSLGKITFLGVGGVAIDGGGFLASNFEDPVAGDDLATKSYVDAVASGLDPHPAVRVKTPATLTSYVAAGSGVGKTLTAPTSSTGDNTIDGVLLSVNDRVLVSFQGGSDSTPHADNGVYYVSTLGDGGSNKF